VGAREDEFMRIRRLWLLLIGVMFLSGCIGGGSSGYGTVALYISDSLPALVSLSNDALPVDDMEHVFVTVSQVRLNRTGGGWETISSFAEGYEVDLLGLQFDKELLGESLLPAGQYTEVRLVVTDGRVVYKDGDDANLRVPSGSTSGIKIKHHFTVTRDAITELYVNMDARDFIKQDNNGLRMRPTAISIADRIVSGAIVGWVGEGSSDVPLPILGEDVVVELWQDEELISETVALRESNGERLAGEFRFAPVQEGFYTLKAYTSSLQGERDSVLVEAGLKTDIGMLFLN